METDQLYQDALHLLQQLIETPSFSKEEAGTADVLVQFLQSKGITTHRHMNNVWAVNRYFDETKPSILLNSHHDTVKPNPGYTKNPFKAIIEEGKLYGLGSNDAGGCLVSLIATFLHFYPQENLPFNFVLGASAEEEISGYNGIEALVPVLPPIAFGIVGEPTQMNLAIAEKGLMVLDGMATGRAGHAAREEGDNAIYKALKDIQWLSTYQFPKVSEWLGPVKMSVTVIQTENKAHNVVPAQCSFVVDVRVTDAYTHEEVLDIIRANIQSDVQPRSMRMRSTRIDADHAIVLAGIALGKTTYGSPTCSDKALMPFQALKCGPGDSARSHTADEFIYLDEIKNGIATYIDMLNRVLHASSK
ncbi:M20 family metallo-hydrolase [Deminuibacter soli]|uniref:M20/M25/M40 family metallo-hydrolase n=1 Tax=Deminuibacter soli TaxID=2291815 RepID=A0A3E1NQR7_9BACT|nr:M20 family metallo-hydrolase [Deminuibacter soli]RFM30250.1 M20/M25/M40 family metallo-hydrolase [Deminuibacter soli]